MYDSFLAIVKKFLGRLRYHFLKTFGSKNTQSETEKEVLFRKNAAVKLFWNGRITKTFRLDRSEE